MLIRQTLLYLPAQLVAPLAQFASTIVWTWYLEPEEMGHFALVTATQEIAYLISLSWLSTYMLRFATAADAPDARARLLGTETAALLASMLPQALSAAACLMLFDLGGDPIVAGLLVAAFFISRSANVHYADRARADTRVLAYTLLQCGGPVGGLALGLALMPTFGENALTLIGAYAAAQAVANLVAMPMIGISLNPLAADRGVLVKAFAYGGPMILLNSFAWLAENNFRYVVERAEGAAAFGLVAVGWGLGRRAASFAAMLVTAAAFPLAARLLNEGDRTSAIRQLRLNAAMLFGVLFPTVAGLALIGDILVDLVVAEPYRAATASVLAAATLGGALRFAHVHTTDQILVLDARFGYAALVDLVEIAATALLTAVGLHFWGLPGAVFGAAAGSAIAFAVSIGLAVRVAGFSFPVGETARIALATGAMALVLTVTPLPDEGVVGLIARVIAGALAYGAVAGLLFLPELRRRTA